MSDAENIAAQFHREYEERAPDHGYKTRDASAVPWDDVPEANRNLMVAVVAALLSTGVIDVGPNADGPRSSVRLGAERSERKDIT